MEYIALAVPKGINKYSDLKFEKISSERNLKFIQQSDINNIDSEVKDGVLEFVEYFDLNVFQIIKLSTPIIDISSIGISQNLINYYLGREQAVLIDFLMDYKSLFPERYYIIFAFEWHKGELCRYKNLNIDKLADYFSENNSWYLWLYDYSKNYQMPNLDIPLIIEIENKLSVT